ncbi:MAG: DUF1573 domain-containing protein [Candidatus Omnitrophota bacterium]|nr:DUF1573 domain-containing protein [Candidatus Omnitrophota bacterium]
MKRIFAVLILVLLSLTSPNCFAAGNNLTGEAALDELYIWDFGTVKQGVELKHDFNLTNDSGKVLNIKNVNTSCGCTGSKADKNKLQAGESTRIEVIFKTKGYSGAIQQFVYVNTDNPDNPILRFTIKAEVVK